MSNTDHSHPCCPKLDDLKSQLAAANARIEEMGSMPGDAEVAEAMICGHSIADDCDCRLVLARTLTATRAELALVKKEPRHLGLADLVARAEALEKELAGVKRDLEIAHRVVDNQKAQATEAVRIGCENITAREAAESSLAAMKAEVDAQHELFLAAHRDNMKAVLRIADLRAAVERFISVLLEWESDYEKIPPDEYIKSGAGSRSDLYLAFHTFQKEMASLPAPSSEKNK